MDLSVWLYLRPVSAESQSDIFLAFMGFCFSGSLLVASMLRCKVEFFDLPAG